MLVLFHLAQQVYAQETAPIHGEELDLTLTVQRQGSTVLPSVLVGDTVFLPVLELFRFLRINSLVSVTGDTLTGFFISENIPYVIDFSTGTVVLGEQTWQLRRSDYLYTEMSVFLRSDLFASMFGLRCTFNFRGLHVDLTTDLELPAVQEMQRERLRRNMLRITGDRVADSTIARSGGLVRPGMLDWSATTWTPRGEQSIWSAGLAVGTGLLGGDADGSATIRSDTPGMLADYRWRWRWADNDARFVRQATVGRWSTALDDGQVVRMHGAEFSNSPTTLRRSFGRYMLDGVTGSAWTVELYMNNVLIDVAKADADGYYRFDIPLNYGSTTLALRFFGPWGEERSEERHVAIPFTFLPGGEVEYTVSGGQIEGEAGAYHAQSRVRIGLGHFMTLGAGADYLRWPSDARLTPVLTSSVRVFDGLLLSGDYRHERHASGLLTLALPGQMVFAAEYERRMSDGGLFVQGSTEQRRLSLSAPVRTGPFSGNVRAFAIQTLVGGGQTIAAEASFSGSIAGTHGNLRVRGERLADISRNAVAYAGLSFRLPLNTIFRPQADVDLTPVSLRALRGSIEGSVFDDGYLTASFGYDYILRSATAQLTFRWELPFAQFTSGLSHNREGSILTTAASGTVGYDHGSASFIADAKSWVRRGGLTVIAYLDLNGNGQRDAGERRLSGVDIRVDGGRMLRDEADSLLRIVDLEPYRRYFVEVRPDNFENIAWQIERRSFSVEVLPDQFATIEVPVYVAADVSGVIRSTREVGRRGPGGLQLQFVDESGTVAAEVLSERDGSYNHLGLKPGEYRVRINPQQLRDLGLLSAPAEHSLRVRQSEDGDILDGGDFTLQPE